MNLRESILFGQVATIRPYFFQKCITLLVAVDLIVLMAERGARYGIDRFNVSHFRWLDTVHQAVFPGGVPSANHYICCLLLTSFVAFYLFLQGHRTWLTCVLCGLYTYAWSMSRLDSYLHHYMISLILGCLAFFPRVDAHALRSSIEAAIAPAQNRRGRSPTRPRSMLWPAVMLIGLIVGWWVVIPNNNAPSGDLVQVLADRGSVIALLLVAAGIVGWFGAPILPRQLPRGQAPAFRTLGLTVGVIYVFTSIAKMDSSWCGGHTLRAVGATAEVLKPFEQAAGMLGIPAAMFWSALAIFVIPLELTLAASYVVGLWQDEPRYVWLRRWSGFGWLLALGLHLNNELMNLVIQWFGYYMLLLATTFLLPASFLSVLGSIFYVPETWLRTRYRRLMDDASNLQTAVALGIVSFLAMIALLLMGATIGLPGGLPATILLLGGLVLGLVFGIVLGSAGPMLQVAATTAVTALLMTLVTWQSSMRFDFYDLRGKTLQQLGRHTDAVRALEQAIAFPEPSAAARSEALSNLGLSYGVLNRPQEAEKYYRKAIEAGPNPFLSHYGLANLMARQGRPADAIEHYRRAIECKSDFSDAYVNLGNVLEFQGRIEEAIACYERAAEIEPMARDIQKMLANARAFRSGSSQ